MNAPRKCKNYGYPSKEPRHWDPMIQETPEKGEGIQVELEGGSKTVVDWINGKARGECCERDNWRHSGQANMRGTGSGWADHISREYHNDTWARKGARGKRKRGRMK